MLKFNVIPDVIRTFCVIPAKQVVLVILVLSFVTQAIYAQESLSTAFKDEIKKANAFYNDHYYQEALNLYLNAHKLDPRDDIKVKIADCYVKINDPQKAIDWFEKLIENNFSLSSKDVLNYVLALTGNADYKKAEKWYETYLELTNDTLVNNFGVTKRELTLFYQDSSQYDVRYEEINTEQSEFSPIFYDKGIAFISSRKNQLFIQNNLPQSGNGYFDLFYTPFKNVENGGIPILGNAKKINGQFSSNIHKGPFTIHKKSMWITLNNFGFSTENTEEKKLAIYEMKKKNGKWIAPVPFPFNNDEYSCGHPTISSDGKIMYFISDMEGGSGGTDIYRTELIKGKWSKPQNLGNKINTIGNEMFPYLQNDTLLYFASNGHPGLGGLDIYKINLTQAELEVINVGYPINSKNDDFGITLNDNGNIGFFSSNRKNKGIDDDIYKVIINVGKPGPLYTKNVSGSISMFESQYQQSSPTIVEEADIIIIDFDSLDPIARGKTDKSGKFSVDIPYAGKFFLMCNKKGSGFYQTTFDIPDRTSFKEEFFIVFFQDDLFETE